MEIGKREEIMSKIRLGISSCLLGERVRWNGEHKLDRFLAYTLGKYVEYVPVCPEVEAGFGVPRETMRLVGDVEAPRLMTSRTGRDMTDQMTAWASRRVAELENENLDGFIFKSDSPSSGMERVKVYDDRGMPRKTGVGLFARAFMDRFPLLPVEEDGRLHDIKLRENFIESIFTLHRWRKATAKGKTRRVLVDFHTRHKLFLMAHSPKHAREMGKLVADPGKHGQEELFQRYQAALLESLSLKTTTAKHVNVLDHIMGYFKKVLTGDEKKELLEVIGIYRRGDFPLIVPVTLLSHYVRKYDEPYLKEQVYLQPHPLELQLRNHS